MALLCGGSKWSSSLRHLPIRKAEAKPDAGGLFTLALAKRGSFSPLYCTDPFKSSPVSSSQPQEGIATAEDSAQKKAKDAQESRSSGVEVSLGKFFRGRLWFLILVFLLTAFGAAYGYLVFTFADVADVPILGVNR